MSEATSSTTETPESRLVRSMLDHLATDHPDALAYAKEVLSEAASVAGKLDGETFRLPDADAASWAVQLVMDGVWDACSEHAPGCDRRTVPGARALHEAMYWIGATLLAKHLAGEVDVVFGQDPNAAFSHRPQGVPVLDGEQGRLRPVFNDEPPF